MAGDSPEAAVDAYLERIRATLSCITPATAFASPHIPGQPRSLTVRAAGQSEPGRIRLSTHGGQGELIFRIDHQFVVEHRGHDERDLFEATNTYYQYRILDYVENEIIVYDWHPHGVSPMASPHLHVSAAGSVVLQQRAGSQRANQKTYLGSYHLPTSKIVLEDIVGLLIREFRVDPLRADWELVLRENREESERRRIR